MSNYEEKNRDLEHEEEDTPKKQNCVLAWLRKNKKWLLQVGIGIATISVLALLGKEEPRTKMVSGLRKKDPDEEDAFDMMGFSEDDILNELLITEDTYAICGSDIMGEAFDVSRHIRTLPDGYRHSMEKEQEALMLGIPLLPNQTIVDPYTKRLTN